jgi:hypothetical protein
MDGQPPISTVPTTATLAGAPMQATLYLRRVTAGQASTAHLEVTDGCPVVWPTFVGGGPTAF